VKTIYITLASAALISLSACESYGPGDLAAGAACGAREEACRDQCAKVCQAGATPKAILSVRTAAGRPTAPFAARPR
jgi:hypothetical protein